MTRRQQLDRLQTENNFDIVVLGGGVNGACLFDTLCRKGYKVLLVDKRDFAAGTSQASGMMVWGGLLYFRNGDLSLVYQLSHDRDRIIEQKPNWLVPTTMRYLHCVGDRRGKWAMRSVLWLYWLIGLGRRRMPSSETNFPESPMLRPGLVTTALSYEEAVLEQSDARFVYRWIAAPRALDQIALNYCNVQGAYSAVDHRWHMVVIDANSGKTYAIQGAMVVNCAGPWTDEVNATFGIDTPFRHALSKGVYLGLARDVAHESSLFFELGMNDDVITYVPWGPIALWGPTETAVASVAEGASPTSSDIDFLLEQYALRFRKPVERSDIVSLRYGIRPLVVDRNYHGDAYPLELSRRQEVFKDRDRPWISCYGGKLTGCIRMANRVMRLIEKTVPTTGNARTRDTKMVDAAPYFMFPGLTRPSLSAPWCSMHELCCTLEDYLRRRTNIAQWVARGGLGKSDAHAPILKDLALQLAHGDTSLASELFETYRRKIESELDPLLAQN